MWLNKIHLFIRFLHTDTSSRFLPKTHFIHRLTKKQTVFFQLSYCFDASLSMTHSRISNLLMVHSGGDLLVYSRKNSLCNATKTNRNEPVISYHFNAKILKSTEHFLSNPSAIRFTESGTRIFMSSGLILIIVLWNCVKRFASSISFSFAAAVSKPSSSSTLFLLIISVILQIAVEVP